MAPLRPRQCRVPWLAHLAAVALVLSCLAITAASAVSNLTLPRAPGQLDRLDPADRARLLEAIHLRTALGDQIWPGFGQASIPVIVWNHAHAFLVGPPEPPAGWEVVPDDRLNDQPYYRQATLDPQNFAVPIGDHWAASLATKWETDQFIIQVVRDKIPGPLQPLFPYRLLVQPSELQMTGLVHESFHVYQILLAPDRLWTAEAVHGRAQDYWQLDASMRANWQHEAGLLADASTAKTTDDAITAARAFLAQRDKRRMAANLPGDLIDFEREIEWEEGLAKYVELAAWQAAASTTSYQPLSELKTDADFRGYQTFGQRWSQELTTLKLQALVEGETRLYYTGMAQAFLLNRLMPGWKDRALTGRAALEDLLREAIAASALSSSPPTAG